MFNPQGFDLTVLDEIIERYDYKHDPILSRHFRPIEAKLLQRIERYGEGVNDYGQDLSAHLRRTSHDGAEFMANALGFSARAARNFHAANLLQDLGKTHDSYDPVLWSLPHSPTPQERAEKRRHTQYGPAILAEALQGAAPELLNHPHVNIVIPAIQFFHHERNDGKGPFALAGDQLGSLIKMTAIVDTKDGDMHPRAHRQDGGRTEIDALLRMKGLPEHDPAAKYAGAFDDMLDRYIEHRGYGAALYRPRQKPLAGTYRLG